MKPHLSNLLIYLRKNFPATYLHWLKFQKKKLPAKVSKVLEQNKPPVFYDSDDVFNKLQSEYSGVPEYGYDSYSTWKRGVDRTNELLQLDSINKAPKNILEAGCGDGMTAHALTGYGHHLTLLDMEDWRDERAKNLTFHKVDINQSLEFHASTFDLIYSFNTFEHLPDPEFTLKELMRLCRPGGYIYLEFGPLYASPWGLHAYRMLKMPYPQFLFSTEFITDKLKKYGINDLGDDKRDELQYVNKWTYQQYQNLFEQYKNYIVDTSAYKIYDHLQIIDNYPQAFTGQGLQLEDICTFAIKIVLKKNHDGN